MMTRYFRSLLFLLILLCVSSGLKAQSLLNHNYFGFDLGFDNTEFYGLDNFYWPIFNEANNIYSYEEFNSLGSGFGYVFGGKVGLAFNDVLGFEAKVRLLSNSASNTETQQWPDPATTSGPLTSATNQYSTTLTNLGLLGLLHVNVSNSVYLAGGLGYSTLLSNSYSASQQLDQTKGIQYNDRLNNIPAGYSLTHPASSLDSIFAKSRTDIQLGAGTVFPIGSNNMLLDLELLVSVPLSDYLQSNYISNLNTSYAPINGLPATKSPSMVYASLTLGLRFPFGGGAGMPEAYDQQSNPNYDAATGITRATIGADGKVPLQGRVTDKSGDPVDATMTVVDLSNNQVVDTEPTDGNGNYNVRVKAPGKYSVTADANGYLFGTSYFEVDNQGRILNRHPNIQLSEASTGRTRLLVFFDFDKATLQRQSYPELNRAVRLMKAVPTMEVEIAGYTDSKGTEDYNKDLSQRRADAVKDYLVKNGIASKRVVATGYGEDSPIASNDTDEGRAENRRVEFVVTRK